MSYPMISIVAMPAAAYHTHPFEDGRLIADASHFERLDVEEQDINHVRITLGGKTWVVDGVTLANTINTVLTNTRQR